MKKNIKISKVAVMILFVIYLIALFGILFIRRRYAWSTWIWADERGLADRLRLDANFIPFKTILGYINAFNEKTMNLNVIISNIVGNLLLFLPMGAALPFLFKRLRRLWKTMLTVFVIVLIVELLQFISGIGSADIDDVILNVFGAFIGYGIWKTPFVQKLEKY